MKNPLKFCLKIVGSILTEADLASPPYGVDVNAARDFGLKVLFTNSLPGKIAPVTTAGYILETINHIIAEIDTMPCADSTATRENGQESIKKGGMVQ